jgi:hypothetical protein
VRAPGRDRLHQLRLPRRADQRERGRIEKLEIRVTNLEAQVMALSRK